MVLAKLRPAGPSTAERIRSVVAAAGSLSLTTDGNCYDLIAMHTVDRAGVLRLHTPADSLPAVEAVCAPDGLRALLEFTDLAPTLTRDRVRAKVTLAGVLTPCQTQDTPDALVLRLDPARAAIECGGLVERVEPGPLAAAAPDVLAMEEAAMLVHLDEDHPDIVERLALLAGPEPRRETRVRPLAMDRYGIVLRFEYPDHHEDARVAFPVPVRSAGEVRRQVERLLSRAYAPRERRGT
ncbi:DUF2470 domain-containing protein [Streptomyces lichenis]|uniref:DUF2470 domain-containing protein n=1 Tax=Streptomyces lichenis TaxID=2306967 RepID=A0ABT0IAF9_9ACTN|nr:DUF2470 domain-containing protein [Streptomyces lichenis]MCK8678280.1 DUF2470 domain-containing protein [Streptomyces lichenis]